MTQAVQTPPARLRRETLEFVGALPHALRLEVRVGDVNDGGHLGHDAVLALTHEARRRWLAEAGFSEVDAGGAGLIMLETRASYRAEAYWGDTLVVHQGVMRLDRSLCEFGYALVREGDGAEIARVLALMGFFDYQRRRAVRMPAAFRERCGPAATPLTQGD